MYWIIKLPKKTLYDKSAVKVNHIDTIRFVLKTKYVCRKKNPDLERKINDADKRIRDASGLVKKEKFEKII